MSDFRREFIKDFLTNYPNKEVLREFIDKLPLSVFDKNFLKMKYCGEKVTPHKIMAYNLTVSKMKNRDGSTGEKWSFNETSKVMNSKGYTFNPADWYYVLNMTYSDKYKQGKTSEDYIEDAYMFLDDIDAPHDKAKRYFLAMCD